MHSFFTEVIHPAWDMLGIAILFMIGVCIFVGNIAMIVEYLKKRGKSNES